MKTATPSIVDPSLLAPALRDAFARQAADYARGRVSQLDFREQLMHQLMEQLPAEQKPQRASARPNPATARAEQHYPLSTQQDRDCQQCSSRSAVRKRSRVICAECGVHLCLGVCFSQYHAVE